MSVQDYFIVEILEEVCLSQNEKIYTKGERLMVWEHEDLDCYWTANTMDVFNRKYAKKLYVFKGEEI